MEKRKKTAKTQFDPEISGVFHVLANFEIFKTVLFGLTKRI